ncbi:MAG: hypothetical protein MAG795_00091 [Candidatus Woesearchaeota archaeon]|nr:hypothetical protein [Candidatus Woesearchaeota archaeon]
MAKKKRKTQIDLKAMALSCGIICGAYVFLIGILASFGYGIAIVNLLSSLYLGFDATFVGALIGAIYAFIDGAVAALLFGWLYNNLSK